MAGPPIRETRAKHAFELPGAAEFSKDRKMRLATWLIGEIQNCPEIWNDLEEGTTDPQTYEKRHTGVKHGVGRDRMPGHWGLIGAAWIISKQPDIQVFTDNLESVVWQAAGFTWPERPCYSTAHERIVELTHYKDAYDRATSKLWHLAMHLDPKVCRHIHVDGTARKLTPGSSTPAKTLSGVLRTAAATCRAGSTSSTSGPPTSFGRMRTSCRPRTRKLSRTRRVSRSSPCCYRGR